MGAITIRGLDHAIVAAIKRRAGEQGISMAEEVRRLLQATYADDPQVRGRAWALRQLERLRRGELPKADISSVETIRMMREERDQQLMDAIEGRSRSRRPGRPC
jgi:plasmid stability protein